LICRFASPDECVREKAGEPRGDDGTLRTYYNVGQVLQALRVTPTMEAGVASHVWGIRGNRRTFRVCHMRNLSRQVIRGGAIIFILVASAYYAETWRLFLRSGVSLWMPSLLIIAPVLALMALIWMPRDRPISN
jgi:hypothetical protein